MRLKLLGENDVGDPLNFVAVLPIGEGANGEERLMNAGIETIENEGKLMIDNVTFDSPAAEAGLDFDQEIQTVLAPRDQIPKELMYIPAFLLFGLIYWLQKGRREKNPHPSDRNNQTANAT